MAKLDCFIHIPKTGGTSVRDVTTRINGHRMAVHFKCPSEDLWCILRNPYDRAISLLWEITGYRPTTERMKRYFEPSQMKRKLYERKFANWVSNPMSYFLSVDGTIDGEIIVQHLVRFENLQSDLDKMFGLKIPHLNKGYRNKDHREYYDEELRQMIYEIYAVDFKNFGYSTLLN